MWRLRLKRVWIPLVAAGLVAVLLVVLAIVGQFSTVPDDERIQVAPTSSEEQDEEIQVDGENDPERQENPLVFPLPETEEPQELAQATAEVLGSPDTARFSQEDYVDTVAPAAPEIPALAGDEAMTPEQWAQQVVETAWSEDPWDDRAELKGTDTFEPASIRKQDETAFLDEMASEQEHPEVREWLLDQNVVVMDVRGGLVREYTNDAGERMQADMGEVVMTVAMVCPDGEDCKVFLAFPLTTVEE